MQAVLTMSLGAGRDDGGEGGGKMESGAGTSDTINAASSFSLVKLQVLPW